ncbi:MAG: hypothetical protein VKO64_12295 [Candidatus Sericytochromatia bacterium]|nr:hypothetical protein [Candidatus Sericytochromatia bacterium]
MARTRWGSFLLGGALAVSACSIVHPSGTDSISAVRMPGFGQELELSAGPATSAPALPAGTGTLVFRIKWPDRQVAAIPATTAAIKFRVQARDGFDKEVEAQFGTSAQMDRIPAGSVTVTATAVRSDGLVLATKAETITLESGTIGSVRLVFPAAATPTPKPLDPPSIASFSYFAAAQGQQVEVRGTGYPTDDTVSFRVFVGGIEVAASKLLKFSNEAFYFEMPNEATRDKIVIQVGERQAVSLADVAKLIRIEIATGPIEVKQGTSDIVIPLVGYDADDRSYTSFDSLWETASGDGGAGTDHTNHAVGHGAPPLLVVGGKIMNASQTGDFHVMAKAGSLLATQSVKVIP